MTHPDTKPSETGGLEPLREIIWQALNDYAMTNMGDGDGHGYPLVDLMSNEGTTIETGQEEMRVLADNLAEAIEAAHPAPTPVVEAVAWLIEWRNLDNPGAKYPGGGSGIIRNNYAAVEGKVATLKGLPWIATVTVTPLGPIAAPPPVPLGGLACVPEPHDGGEAGQ